MTDTISQTPRGQARLAARDLAADLAAWLDWARATGATDLPAAPPAPRAPSLTARPASARPASARPATGAPTPSAPVARAAAPATARPAPAHGPESLDAIRTNLGECTRCGLAAGRKHIVFGVGDPDAPLALVGEAPGYHEDLIGEPFVGRSGQLLTRMLACIGLQRGDVYICNVIKCRPPNNRDPLPDEVASCSPFLHRQLAAVRPRVIMTLGRFAAANIVGVDAPLSRLRGQLRAFGQTPVVASYHPSYLLRQPAQKRQAWEDFIRVRDLLRAPAS